MDLSDLAGGTGDGGDVALALQSVQERSNFLSKLSTEVDSLVINLDQERCRVLLEQIDSQTPAGEHFAEMAKLRTLRIVGCPKQWRSFEHTAMRLFQLLRPVELEELTLVGVDQMKVIRAMLSHTELHPTLTTLSLGLHGFHF